MEPAFKRGDLLFLTLLESDPFKVVAVAPGWRVRVRVRRAHGAIHGTALARSPRRADPAAAPARRVAAPGLLRVVRPP